MKVHVSLVHEILHDFSGIWRNLLFRSLFEETVQMTLLLVQLLFEFEVSWRLVIFVENLFPEISDDCVFLDLFAIFVKIILDRLFLHVLKLICLIVKPCSIVSIPSKKIWTLLKEGTWFPWFCYFGDKHLFVIGIQWL